MRKKLTILFVISFLVMGLFLFECLPEVYAAEETIRVRMASLFPKEHFIGRRFDWMATELEKRSNGRFKCEVFHGGTAGGEKENLEDILSGSLEWCAGAGTILSEYSPEENVLELPFYGWKDRAEALEVMRGYLPKFRQAYEKVGFYVAGIDVRDFWGIAYKDPITSLDSIKNKKFRSVNAPYEIALTKFFGAIPIPMAYSEAYMSFKTDICEGVLTAVTLIYPANWHEVLKCFVDLKYSLPSTFQIISKKWLDSLPQDLREIVLEVADEGDYFTLREFEKDYKIYKEKMLKAGVVFVEFDTSSLKEKAYTFRDEYIKGKGPEAYKFYQDWIAYVEEVTGRPQR